jgi:hypothetical protein
MATLEQKLQVESYASRWHSTLVSITTPDYTLIQQTLDRLYSYLGHDLAKVELYDSPLAMTLASIRKQESEPDHFLWTEATKILHSGHKSLSEENSRYLRSMIELFDSVENSRDTLIWEKVEGSLHALFPDDYFDIFSIWPSHLASFSLELECLVEVFGCREEQFSQLWIALAQLAVWIIPTKSHCFVSRPPLEVFDAKIEEDKPDEVRLIRFRDGFEVRLDEEIV